MSALIILRLVGQRRARRRVTDRAAVEAAFVGILQGSCDAQRALGPYRTDALLMAESLLSLLTMVRGNDLQRIVDALCALGVDNVLRACAVGGAGGPRLDSVEVLGAFPGDETRAVLGQAARRGGPRVRLAALRSLVQAGGEVTVARVLNHIQRREVPLSGRLGELLQMVVLRDPQGALQAFARVDLAPRTRILLLDALGKTGSSDALDLLVAQSRDLHSGIRVAAVAALGKLKAVASEPALLKALEDSDWRVRCAAAEAGGEAGLSGLTNGLIVLLVDPVWLVRFTAAAALTKLGVPGAQELPPVLLGIAVHPQPRLALDILHRVSA